MHVDLCVHDHSFAIFDFCVILLTASKNQKQTANNKTDCSFAFVGVVLAHFLRRYSFSCTADHAAIGGLNFSLPSRSPVSPLWLCETLATSLGSPPRSRETPSPPPLVPRGPAEFANIHGGRAILLDVCASSLWPLRTVPCAVLDLKASQRQGSL